MVFRRGDGDARSHRQDDEHRGLLAERRRRRARRDLHAGKPARRQHRQPGVLQGPRRRPFHGPFTQRASRHARSIVTPGRGIGQLTTALGAAAVSASPRQPSSRAGVDRRPDRSRAAPSAVALQALCGRLAVPSSWSSSPPADSPTTSPGPSRCSSQPGRSKPTPGFSAAGGVCGPARSRRGSASVASGRRSSASPYSPPSRSAQSSRSKATSARRSAGLNSPAPSRPSIATPAERPSSLRRIAARRARSTVRTGARTATRLQRPQRIRLVVGSTARPGRPGRGRRLLERSARHVLRRLPARCARQQRGARRQRRGRRASHPLRAKHAPRGRASGNGCDDAAEQPIRKPNEARSATSCVGDGYRCRIENCMSLPLRHV